MKTKYIYGWVIEMKKGNLHGSGFYSNRSAYSSPLRLALVFFSRKEARSLAYLDETVRKVELTRKGIAKRVCVGR